MLSDETYRLLQMHLLTNPDSGKLEKESGGLRKFRWFAKGHGKSGGVRIIYYWFAARETILLLFVYAKNERDDLTPGQLEQLRRVVEEEYI